MIETTYAATTQLRGLNLTGLREWRSWVANLPWKYKWFVVLIFIRPFIDLTYDTNIISSYSPLDFVGLLTPLIILFLFLTRSFPRMHKSRGSIGSYFFMWCLLVLLNSILILIGKPSIGALRIALKVTLPVYLYFFLRHFIRSKRHLDGILLTVLYSAIFPAILLVYEIIIGPLKIQESRGVVRYMAGYADIGNLALLILFSTLIAGYFWIQQFDGSSKIWIKSKYLILIAFLCVLGLVHIKHMATFITFFAIFSLFILYNFNLSHKKILTVALILIISGSMFIQSDVQGTILSLIGSDLYVLRGERNVEAAFHGRMGRWIRMREYFKTNISLPERMIGTIGVKKPILLGAGTHNDYLRILFTTGYIGLGIYILFLMSIFRKSLNMPKSQRFLTMGMLLIILLMSVSSNPTVYVLVNYIFMSLVAFLVLPASSRS